LDFAHQNQIPKFEVAFKAFYHDKLVERAITQAKDKMAADIQQRSKAGLLGTSQAPTKTGNVEVGMPSNYKSMSMNKLTDWLIDKYA